MSMQATTPAHTVAANVRAEMARRRVSQSALAKHLGMAQTAVSRRLTGVVSFDVNEVAAVAAFLDVPLASLMPIEPVTAGAA